MRRRKQNSINCEGLRAWENILFPGLFWSVLDKRKNVECWSVTATDTPLLQNCVALLWGKNVLTLMSHLKKRVWREATGGVWSHMFWPDVLALTGVGGQMDNRISKSKMLLNLSGCVKFPNMRPFAVIACGIFHRGCFGLHLYLLKVQWV